MEILQLINSVHLCTKVSMEEDIKNIKHYFIKINKYLEIIYIIIVIDLIFSIIINIILNNDDFNSLCSHVSGAFTVN